MSKRSKLFVSYCHKDVRFLRAVMEHLAVFEREGLLDVFEDTQIRAGEPWLKRLHAEMSQARVGLLLVSAPFLSSPFVRTQEIPKLFARHAKSGMLIYPLLVRPCPWQQVDWLAQIQLRPQNSNRRAKAVSDFSGAARDQVLADVATEIASLVGPRETTVDRFDPRETVREGFLRVLKASGSKLKAALLKERGIATHDIRLSIEASKPVALLEGRSPPVDFYYLRFFERAIKNTRLRVLNASRTEPVVTEVHFFLEIPSKLGISAVSSWGPMEVVSIEAGATVSIALDLQSDGLRPEALKPGVVMAIPDGTFMAGLVQAIDPEIRRRLGNEPDYCPPEDWLEKAIDAYVVLLNKCDVWYGLVLDNSELLPFKWQHEERRFAQGFWTEGTVV